jgi:hypothetical protein
LILREVLGDLVAEKHQYKCSAGRKSLFRKAGRVRNLLHHIYSLHFSKQLYGSRCCIVIRRLRVRFTILQVINSAAQNARLAVSAHQTRSQIPSQYLLRARFQQRRSINENGGVFCDPLQFFRANGIAVNRIQIVVHYWSREKVAVC